MEDITHPHTGDPRCICATPDIAARLDIDEPCQRARKPYPEASPEQARDARRIDAKFEAMIRTSE